MTDERTEYGTHPAGGFDDDRLLALALGLDDDAELLQAAEADADLGARLAAMRADVDRIGAQVRAAVPEPDASYTDLSGQRWGGLGEYLEIPATAAAPRRGRRWWRVVAPVAAIAVLALVAGIVALDQGGQSLTTGSSAEVARTATDADDSFTGQTESTTSGGEAAAPATTPGTATAPGAVASPPVDTAPRTVAQRLADQLDRFAVVVLAKARQATGALQRFAVLRVFKGDAPQVVELEVDDQPADAGRLHLLMLDPMTAGYEAPQSPEPLPALTTGGDVAFGRALAVTYTYHGEPTMVREFAAGTDPDLVSLPIP
ncbi:MAG: hypothetical protein ACM3MJ_03570 [Deltaproteobacteria bacterium]